MYPAHVPRSALARRLAVWARFTLAGLALLGASAASQAVSSFARQTGMACAACHVGGFGPQLTDFGIQFKVGGYTMARPDAPSVPLSGMVIVSGTRTAAALPEPLPDHLRANNNVKLDQASLFLAGRLAESLGIFMQVTHDGIAHSNAIDETELRYARKVNVGQHSATVGLSINNDPGMSDLFHGLPTWGFPFVSSAVAPGPASTLLDGGLAHYVIGPTAFALVDNQWYAALGTYQTLSTATQRRLGLDPASSPGVLHGASFGRLAVKDSWGDHSLAAGLVMLNTGLQPDRSLPLSNHVRDTGLDATYRWQRDADHVFSLFGNFIHEAQQRTADLASGGADQPAGHLNSSSVTASYALDQTWGFNLQRFAVYGSADATLYADGFANGSPRTTGSRLQLDWTPYGKTAPKSGWDPSLRIGLQYTAYDSFNGARRNYDGNGRNAADNNSLYLFAWLMF